MTTSPTPTTETPSTTNSTALAVYPAKKNKSALEQFEKQAGGRDALVDSIGLATLDKKQQHFLDLLTDPKRQKHSINTIARDSGLTPLQVIDLFRSAAFAKANALAMGRMADALPEVIDDIAAKSVDAKVECPTCFGKKLPDMVCPQCYGKGQILRPSDWDRQKTILEATGITKKAGGVNVQVNSQTNVGIVSPGSFFSNYVKASDKAANDINPDSIDAEFEETSK